MKILGIETSCDETGVAIFEHGRGIVAERLSSQVGIHAAFGGVVPELASRDHIAKLAPMVRAVLDETRLDLKDLDALAYTAGPGLIGALLVGASFAASLAQGLDIPSVPVHHMEGHLLACMLEAERPEFPFVALLVSGGHTQLVHVAGVGRYRIIGETLDDAAGEAFDKVARLLALPYPGGPELAALAEAGDPDRFPLPRPLRNQGLDFSFSGLKTAARLVVESCRSGRAALGDRDRADIAASFQAAAVETLVGKAGLALASTGLTRLVVAGGVGANRLLRQSLEDSTRRAGARVYYPRPALCTDNGAMIAYAGSQRLPRDGAAPPQVIARPRWPLDELVPPD
jgi:N6-L-threonylcarbamoyladenine synthase